MTATAAQRYNKRLNETLSPERIEAATEGAPSTMDEQTVSVAAIKALANFTSSDQFRPALTKINVQNGIATTADGFVLAQAKVNTNGFTGNLQPKQLLDIAKTVKHPDHIHLVNHADEPRAVVTGRDTTNWGPIAITDETFPDATLILPPLHETDRVISISPSILKQLVDAARATGAQAVQLRIQDEPDGKPIRFQLRNELSTEVSGILMPMAISRIADWHHPYDAPHE